ncbi:hypothetical protein CEUSTIGMA_g9877.t1 [Chlamydomonas eustigma]|uniref:Uncharacterized protein n=1 Tax=Chlamydomonas eustigma TaxID=1157962 RepID=A0A250XI24_9CHLO|nr:hypothetical protein CEUSTIGMA_g9877.t1 [Chlamydomonas eustigma]|eukprot:GAX82450.1 hypothetical protein CEUSTIGMA_g9877.t1 [Chlamydomonas eustigma]
MMSRFLGLCGVLVNETDYDCYDEQFAKYKDICTRNGPALDVAMELVLRYGENPELVLPSTRAAAEELLAAYRQSGDDENRVYLNPYYVDSQPIQAGNVAMGIVADASNNIVALMDIAVTPDMSANTPPSAIATPTTSTRAGRGLSRTAAI